MPSSPEPLSLEPRLERRLASLLGAGDFLPSLVDALGSPLSVLLPDQIAENVERFRGAYGTHRLGGQVYFAHKANRSSALLRRLAATDAAVDVASLGELQHALGAGFTPDRIMATGPKNREFLWLAARTGVLVNADSRGELDELAALVRARRLARIRVLVRLSAFDGPGVRVRSRPSRFGIPAGEVDGLLKTVEQHADALELIGVGYHLDTTSPEEKARALEGCIRVMDAARGRGLRPQVVDIGGGFGVNYLEHAGEWERYTSELTAAVLGHRPPLTWRGHGYGLRNDAGTLRGALGLYPAHRPVAGARYLDELLALPSPSFGGRALATLLLENLYDLYTEPGRALVDQCGLVLARVLEVRRTDSGEPLVRLAMKADDAALEEHGVLMDPMLLGRDGGRVGRGDGDGPAVGAYLAGSLCLEADLITRRMVFLPRLPRPGELLAFANTAGYCMDFQTSRAQHQPVARKVAAWQEDGSWRWCLDEQYWPITRPGGEH
ncbi:Y4yA family PLP-dependent enzyme [Streptomyces sp. NPDC093707]|uniref:Y4yA family PLP-dependent enzyme n=1 Tax=Streptomyces sp. NPDC093707 TaxID=3154984 RepID=UPI00344DF994